MVKWTPQLCRTLNILLFCSGLPWASVCNAGDLGSIPGWEDPLEKGMAIVQVFLPGEFHGQRSLASYSSWGRKESDTTERLTLHYIWMTIIRKLKVSVSENVEKV